MQERAGICFRPFFCWDRNSSFAFVPLAIYLEVVSRRNIEMLI